MSRIGTSRCSSHRGRAQQLSAAALLPGMHPGFASAVLVRRGPSRPCSCGGRSSAFAGAGGAGPPWPHRGRPRGCSNARR
eukprot:793148-Alexandrium_andersonii.AAC.1